MPRYANDLWFLWGKVVYLYTSTVSWKPFLWEIIVKRWGPWDEGSHGIALDVSLARVSKFNNSVYIDNTSHRLNERTVDYPLGIQMRWHYVILNAW
jgi:hypothetical protein